MGTTNVEIELNGPTLVDLTKFAGTGMILKGSCQDHCMNSLPCNFIVVCVLYCLLGSLVIVHVCVACMVVRLCV